jgi:DNA-binding transcriptional LysR family regulator
VLPQAINALLRNRPDVAISVVDGPYDTLLSGLRHGEIDLLVGALRMPLPIADVSQELLFDDPLTVVARVDHPLAGKSGLTRDELLDYPWIVPREGTPTRQHFNCVISGEEGAARIGMIESSSLSLIRSLLADSDRLTMISAHQVRREVELGLLARLDFPLPGTERPIGVTTRSDWRPTATQEAFLDHLRNAGQMI